MTQTPTWSGLTPDGVAALLAKFDRPWWIAGGWAVDLFLGRQTREHADIDVAMLRGDEVALPRVLAGWEIKVAHDGALEPWDGSSLVAPRHQLWARRDAAGPWDLEVLLEDHDGGHWHCRRDSRVRLPLDRFGRSTAAGVGYVRPEVALLYKAKGWEIDRNAADFAAAAPSLDAEARTWLIDALRLAHPGHAWLEALTA
jgi:hypothetical protein